MSSRLLVLLAFSVLNGVCMGQDSDPERDLSVRDFRPIPMLKVAATDLQQAKFPVIDCHTHFGFRLKGSREQLAEYVEAMDRHNIAICVSLDCKLGEEEDHINFLNRNGYQNRFATFVHIDFRGDGAADQPESWACNQSGFVRECVEKLKVAKEKGCIGVKFFKQFGLGYRQADGTLIKIDDKRFDPIWEVCGKLEMPVIIHTADPAAFFLPTNEKNERWEELSRHPDWSFYGEEFPSRDELFDARNRVIERHPDTLFIGAHMANNSEDLQQVGQWLERYPNLVVEPASRINELGRQPYTARKFFIRFQDRILFGTDGPWPEKRLTYYWRFMETFDENFPYSEKEPPPQGLWRIDGIQLPDEVLEKIYHKNALRILPGLQKAFDNSIDSR